jgi:hypothetical protein
MYNPAGYFRPSQKKRWPSTPELSYFVLHRLLLSTPGTVLWAMNLIRNPTTGMRNSSLRRAYQRGFFADGTELLVHANRLGVASQSKSKCGWTIARGCWWTASKFKSKKGTR